MIRFWKNLKIGKKFAVGFGLVILLLVAVGVWSYLGVGTIVFDAGQVIDGNRLDATLSEKEVEHLIWANQLNAFLTDEDIETLRVETDDHQCQLGKWLYGEGREKAVAQVPALAPLLNALEEPHRILHNSAVEIARHYRRADPDLGVFLLGQKVALLEWLGAVEDLFITSATTLDMETDPRGFSLGQWLDSDEADQLKRQDQQFAIFANELEEHYNTMFKSLRPLAQMVSEGRYEEGLALYNQTTHIHFEEAAKQLDRLIAWQASAMEGMNKAINIYSKTTLPKLETTRTMMEDIRKTAKANMISDDVLLEDAVQTRRGVFIVGLVGVLVGGFLAYFFGRGIAGPIVRIAGAIRNVAVRRDLTVDIPKESEDEIGQMTAEFNTMLVMFNDALGKVDDASRQIAENAGEVLQRATVNRDRAEGQEKEVQESDNILKAMGKTAGEVQGASNAQRDAANASRERIADLVDNMGRVGKASSGQSEGVKEAMDRVVAMGETGALVVATAGKQGEAVAKVTASVNEFAKAVEEMTRIAARSTEHGKEVLDAANEGARSVAETVSGMKSIAESSDQISEIISVITEIAEQTNLLALNAAIEAARAGSHGKGFAVVADEVGKLAQRSSEAAKEITQLIKDSTTRVAEGTQLTDQLAQALKKIGEGGQVNMDAIEEISRTSGVLSRGATDIHSMMDELNSLAQEIAMNAGKQRERREASQKALEVVDRDARMIVDMVSDADKSAAEVNEQMDAIAKRTEDIEKMTSLQAERSQRATAIAAKHVEGARATVEGAGRVMAVSNALKDLAQSLSEEVGRFKHKAKSDKET